MDLQEFNKSLTNYLRKGLIMKIMGEEQKASDQDIYFAGLTSEEISTLKAQSKKFSEIQLRNMLNIFINAANKIKYSPIPQLPLELAIGRPEGRDSRTDPHPARGR